MLENERSQMWAQGDTEADYWRVRNLLRVITSRTDRQMTTTYRGSEERSQDLNGRNGVFSYISLRMGRLS